MKVANLQPLIQEIKEGFRLVTQERSMQEDKDLLITKLQNELEELKNQVEKIEDKVVEERKQNITKDEIIKKLKNENEKVVEKNNELRESLDVFEEKRKLEVIEVEKMKMIWDWDIAQAHVKFETNSREREFQISLLKNEVSKLKDENDKNNKIQLETLMMKINDRDEELKSISFALQLKFEELNEIIKKKNGKEMKMVWVLQEENINVQYFHV